MTLVPSEFGELWPTFPGGTNFPKFWEFFTTFVTLFSYNVWPTATKFGTVGGTA